MEEKEILKLLRVRKKHLNKKVSEEKLVELVNKNFDLRPGAIIRDLDLRKPIYKQVAAYGHFGRNDLDLPWERTDKAEIFSTLTMNYGFPCCIKTVEETVNGKIFLLLFYIIWYKAAQ